MYRGLVGFRASFNAVVSAVVISSTEDIVGGSGGGTGVCDVGGGDRGDRLIRAGLVGVRRTVRLCLQELHLDVARGVRSHAFASYDFGVVVN